MKKKRLSRKAKRIGAIFALFAIELTTALAAGGITYAALAPIAYRERGYFAFGGELLLAYIVAMAAYMVMHWAIFHEKKGEAHERSGSNGSRAGGK